MNSKYSCMGVFHHEESPKHPNRCKCLVATLKEVLFSLCHTFGGRFSTASLVEESSISEFDEEQEVVVSAVISRAMEKQKHKPRLLRHSFSWAYSPATKECYVTGEVAPQQSRVLEGGDQEHNQREEFVSVKSCFSSSCRSSSVNGETFYSVNAKLSRCSSLNELDLSKYWRRSIIQELCHYEGWPFGLCRRALLLPPLPKSPSESWLSRQIQPSAAAKKP